MAYRKRKLVTSLCAIACTLQWAYPAWGGNAEAEPPTLAPLVRRISPSVVSVTSTKHVDGSPRPVDPSQGFPDVPPSERTMAGSGVVLDAALGLVVTAI